ELLTGRLAFPSEAHRFYQNFKWPSELRRDITAKVDDVLKKALHEDPELRYQSAQELAQAFENALITTMPLPKPPAPKPPVISRRALAGATGASGLLIALLLGGSYLPWHILTNNPTVTPAPVPGPAASPTISPTTSPVVFDDRLNISLYQQNPSGDPELVSTEMTFRNSARAVKTGG